MSVGAVGHLDACYPVYIEKQAKRNKRHAIFWGAVTSVPVVKIIKHTGKRPVLLLLTPLLTTLLMMKNIVQYKKNKEIADRYKNLPLPPRTVKIDTKA